MNQYKPWEDMKITESEYWQMRYVEARREQQNLRTSVELFVKYFTRVKNGEAGDNRPGILKYEEIILGVGIKALAESPG